MSDSRGGRFYVFELNPDGSDGPATYEDDLTTEQRIALGLTAPPAPSLNDSPQATEEVGPDV